MIGLYRITNNINNKLYFGQTIDLERREKQYFKYDEFPNDHIKNSFNKYGKENFDFNVCFECPEEMLDVCEELLIYLLDTQNPDKGYNKDSGGNLNKRLSGETKQKMSESHKGSKNYNWRHDLDNDEIVDLFVNQDKSENEIGKILNADHKVIHNRLVKMGVDTSKNKHNCRHDLDNDEIVDLFVNQDKTETEIAKILNTTQATIHSRLVKMGVDSSRNTIGYFRVFKKKEKSYKQGFRWVYQYCEGDKRKSISSVDLSKLEEKVKAKGLEWRKL